METNKERTDSRVKPDAFWSFLGKNEDELKLLNRIQIPLFFLFTYVISWAPWYIMGEPTLLAWVPALVALGMVIIIDRKKYLRAWVRSALHWRVGLKWWIIAIFGTGGVMLIAIGLYVLFGNEPPNYVVFREELWLLPLYFLINIIFGSIGEELGWRGYILPQLQKKYGPVISSVIIGFFWGIWHLPMFFNPTSDKFTLGLIFIIPFTCGCIGNSLIMTWIYNKSRESALLGGIIWHAALNFWTAVLLVSNFSILAASSGEITPRIDPPLYYILEILFIIVGLILIFMTKGQLGREIERDKITSTDATRSPDAHF